MSDLKKILTNQKNSSSPGSEASTASSGSPMKDVSPWDILCFIGDVYIRLRSLRTTLYQIRNGLIILPEQNQARDIEFALIWAMPQYIFSVSEALGVLVQIDVTLNPRSQIYTKVLKKWETLRDDSAHYAHRLFQTPGAGKNSLSTSDDFGNVTIQGFSYRFDDDILFVGDEEKRQAASVVDALDALRAIYRALERKLDNNSERYPIVSKRDTDIERTLGYLARELDTDIDWANEADPWFECRYEERSKKILALVKKGSVTEKDLIHDSKLPKSIAFAVIGRMVREKELVSRRSENDAWVFSRK